MILKKINDVVYWLIENASTTIRKSDMNLNFSQFLLVKASSK